MTFDDWMVGISERHKPSDDGITLRMLRACWAEAQAAERERCAKLCEAWVQEAERQSGPEAAGWLHQIAQHMRGLRA